jgi:DNA-binding transcriptional LysR family regulator
MNAPESPIDLVLLQTFYEVARVGSLTGAAARLNRSQPAVSHRIRALESDLGVRLFEKVGRRLSLTEYGRRLQARCHDLMALSHSIRESVGASAADEEAHVAIGTLPTVVSHLLVDTVADLMRDLPVLQLSFVLDLIPELCEALRTGRCDVLVVVGELEVGTLDVEELGTTQIVAAMAPAVAPRKRGTIKVAELRRMRYLAWVGHRDVTFDRVDTYARAHKLFDPYTPRIPHIESLRALAATGAGFTLLPAYTTRADVAAGRLVALRPSGLATRTPISLVRRPGQILTPGLDHVVSRLRALRF